MKIVSRLDNRWVHRDNISCLDVSIRVDSCSIEETLCFAELEDLKQQFLDVIYDIDCAIQERRDRELAE